MIRQFLEFSFPRMTSISWCWPTDSCVGQKYHTSSLKEGRHWRKIARTKARYLGAHVSGFLHDTIKLNYSFHHSTQWVVALNMPSLASFCVILQIGILYWVLTMHILIKWVCGSCARYDISFVLYDRHLYVTIYDVHSGLSEMCQQV